MERTSTGLIRLAKLGLVLVFVWGLLRAVTQSVTPGEALNYDRFIGPHWNESLAQYDVNNRFLNTLLVRISTARIHLTEFSMRLPSLLFGALYMWAAYRISRRWFGGGRMFLAVLGLLVLNPLIMDAMSEASGYGMALTCWMWAVELVSSGGSLSIAGVLLGLSVSASFAFLAPAVALILLVASRRKLGYMPHLAFLTAFILLVLPLNHAEKDLINQGATSLRETLNELTAGSLDTDSSVPAAIVRVVIALLTALGVLVSFRRNAPTLMCLMGGSLALSLALLKLAHWKPGTGFPQDGAIYLIPMVTIFTALLAQHWGRESVQVAFVVLAAVLVARYADHLHLAYRAEGDLTGGRYLAKALRADAGQRGVRVGVSAPAEPILRYYRWRYRQANWAEIQPVAAGSFDYYVLTAQDANLVGERNLKVLYRDPGLILARGAGDSPAPAPKPL
jgi:hypothetical protein